MAKTKLAKRFEPYADQAATQTAIRYGAQESGLQSIFDQRTRDYTRDANAQQTAYRSLLGSLQSAPADLNRVYNDVGLNPGLLQQMAGTPTGARLAGQLARSQAGIQQQTLGAQTGNQYQRQHLADEYGDDVSQIQQQGQALQREKGLYQSSLLDQLISDDRARRSAINAAARKQQHDDAAAQAAQDAATRNALIGQGLLPDEKGVLQPLPGGKADPNAPGNKPKPKKPTKPSGADRTIRADYRKATAWIKTLDESTEKGTPAVKADPTTGVLAQPAKPGVKDPAKRRQIVQEILLMGVRDAGIPSITSAGLDAALDIYYDSAISNATVQALHDAGAKVKFLGDVKTANQRAAEGRRNARRTVTRPTQAVPGLGALG